MGHNIDKLAELSDFEIAELEHLAPHQMTRAEGIARTSPTRQSLLVALYCVNQITDEGR